MAADYLEFSAEQYFMPSGIIFIITKILCRVALFSLLQKYYAEWHYFHYYKNIMPSGMLNIVLFKCRFLCRVIMPNPFRIIKFLLLI
jgi:hypothetical protein